MKEELIQIYQQIPLLVSSKFNFQIGQDIDKHGEFIKRLSKLAIEYLNKAGKLSAENSLAEFAEGSRNFHSSIFSVLGEIETRRASYSIDEDYKLYCGALSNYLNELPEEISRIQDDERFNVLPSDSRFVKILKIFKRILFAFSQLPVVFVNLFRRIFQKEPKPKRNWTHKVPLRNLAYHYFHDEFILTVLPLLNEYHLGLISAANEVWEAVEKIDGEISEQIKIDKPISDLNFSSYKTNIEVLFTKQTLKLTELKNSLFKSSEDGIKSTLKQFEDAYSRAGTIELFSRSYSAKKIRKHHSSANTSYNKLKLGWGNTFFAFTEDWKLTAELGALRYSALYNLYSLSAAAREKIDFVVFKQFNRISEFLADMNVKIENFSGTPDEFIPAAASLRKLISGRLAGELIPVTIESLLEQDLPAIAADSELNLINDTGNVSNKRGIAKTDTYDRKFKDSEINYISPAELILFETFPRFGKSIAQIKNRIIGILEKIQAEIRGIEHVTEFNLETAVSALERKDRSLEEAKAIAIEGISRAINKLEDSKALLNSINEIFSKDLKDAVQIFNGELISLTISEKALQIKLRITKAKAVERARVLKRRALNYVRNILPSILHLVKRFSSRLKNSYQKLKEKFGLGAKVTIISSQISDFLTETESALNKLPYVYQRLFQIEPLDEEKFFVGREREISQLNTAFKNWQRGFYATAALVGEKGGGATSLLNVFINRHCKNEILRRVSLPRIIYRESEFLKFVEQLFSTNELRSLNDAVSYLNNLPEKHVVVIENLQHFYLKKVGGFQALKMFFELISKTNKNIFWVATTSLYSWIYLQKTVNIPDHFGYVIKLEKLNNDQIIDVILKRHSVSGYKVYYEPSEEDLRSKAYKKIPDEEKQNYLKNEYFKKLNNFAESNISLALLFWLRSTADAANDTITITAQKEFDFDITSVLSAPKAFLLYNLLLHDGATEQEVSEVFNQTALQCKLLLLLLVDDGILVKREEQYLINPLLYRQVVRLLKSKNIIH